MPLSGRKRWHKGYRHPDIGFSALFFDFGQKRLGKAYSILTFIDRHIDKKRRLTYRFGFGTGFHSQHFDKEKNYTNQAIGSWQTAAVQMGLIYKHRISDEWFMQYAFMLSHYSNGASKMPNSGLNLPTVSVGLRRGARTLPAQPMPDSMLIESVTPPYGWSWQAMGSFGRKETYPVGGKKFMVYTMALYGSYRHSRNSAWQVGVEGIINETLKEEKRLLFDSTYWNRDIRRLSVLGGHELFFGRMSLLTQMGIYVYKKVPLNPFLYTRIGMKYYWTPYFYSGANLRAHFGKADGVEWSMGYTFYRSKKK